MTARRFLTLALLLLGPAWSAASACNGRGSPIPFRAAHPTVEPTLPLLLEMRLEGVERTDAEARARLVVVVTADRDIRDLELDLPGTSGGEKLDTLEIPVQRSTSRRGAREPSPFRFERPDTAIWRCG